MSQNAPKPFVVELFGLPGSGKSHVANLLTAYAEIDHIPQMVSRLDMLRGVVRSPGCALRWLRFLAIETVRGGEWGLARYRLSLIAHMFGRFARARASRHGVVLLDEGFMQRVLSVSARRLSSQRVLTLMRGLWPDYVLVVEAQGPRFHRYGPEHIRSQASPDGTWKMIMKENYEVVQAAMVSAGVPYTVVGQDTAPGALITKLRDMIAV